MLMRNRHGNEYTFEQIDENTFRISGNLDYWRFGGKDGEEFINYNDLGFVDPSGGPFISTGYIIDNRKVNRIYMVDENIFFEVSNAK